MAVTVRRIEPRDQPRWRELWDAYTRCYEREPGDDLARHAWTRIMDPACPVHAIVAKRDGQVIGIANYLLHENVSALTPTCYLQDLFVDPADRGAGTGKALIDWLVDEMAAQGWSSLYWHTRETNYRARGLYDKYTPHSGFLRYIVRNPG
jgi:ribosomal protein S18 acetylase RimI-like enzyme